MAFFRTKLILILISVNIIVAHSDSELKYDKDSLLRGSGEERDKEYEEIAMPDTKEDQIEKETVLEEKDLDNIRTTTDVVTTTSSEEIPEALGLRIPEEAKDFDDKNDEYFELKNNAAETTTDNADTDTLSMIDNTVYVGNFSNNIDDTKTELPSASTTRAMDDMEVVGPTLLGLADETASSGRRNAKTDNSEPKVETRLYEPKFEALPAAKSKSDTFKGWLEDPWLRPPPGILVPLRPMALSRALAVWNDLTVDGLNVKDIVIVGYDANGVNWRSRHNLRPSSNGSGHRAVAEALSKLLLKYQGVNADTASDGTMRALAAAAKLVPYDSALFVVTDKGAGDAQRLPLALRALVEKRLKVYTIWTDPSYPSGSSEQQLQELRNISQHTEGEVLPYSMQVMDMDGNLPGDQWDMNQTRQGRLNLMAEEESLDTLLVRRGGGEAISLGVPVENGVTSLRIFIQGMVEHAVLYPPNDAPQVDLYNMSSVLSFSPASRTDSMSPRDVHLVFPGAELDVDTLTVLPMSPATPEGPAPTVGLWHLSVRCDKCDFRLCVTARAHLHLRTSVQHVDMNGEMTDMLKLQVEGQVSSIRESVLVDEYGIELAKLPFSYQPQENGQLPEDLPETLQMEVKLPSVKGSRIYAKISGRDARGEPFVRFSGPLNVQEVRMSRSAAIITEESFNDLERAEELNAKEYERLRYNESNILPYNRAISQVVNQRGSLLTSVQIGLSTRLYGAPGDNLQLHFEVTNFREQSIRFQFEAVGELRFLRGINPTSQTIAPGQTANVIVSVGITASAQPGARDLITFTAYGLEQVSISAYVYVMNSGDPPTDVWSPEVRHNFQGTCIGRLGTDCAQHVWSATVIARDAVGGLLRLSSSPIGMVYDSNFISGTREEVIAIYRSTCCAPRVVMTAVDAFGNANSYIIDISSYFTEAGIAAIVLGVFLLIAIIALIVFLIYWCVKRRKESRELPTYATSSRNVS